MQEAPEPAPVSAAKAVKVPVTGSIVPHFGEGMTAGALAPDYRRVVELVESGPGGGEGVSAKEIASGGQASGHRYLYRSLDWRGYLSSFSFDTE